MDPEQTRSAISSVPKDLFVGGYWTPAEGNRTMPVENPATGDVLCAVADADRSDAVRAIRAAADAQAAWAATPPRQRSELLRAGYQALLEAQDSLALVISAEVGKPFAQARAEVEYAAEFLRWFAEEAVRVAGSFVHHPENPARRTIVMRRPIGPSLLITPWNFPLAMGTRKIGPALAAGCCVVLKPAPQTPLSALALAEILTRVGVPGGVVNVVPTSAASPIVTEILATGLVRKLSFTGSTAVGKRLLEQCAASVISTSMELGGNAAFMVFDDADIDAAVESAMAAKMRNMGQTCTSANRFYVQAGIAEPFAKRLVERYRGLRMDLQQPALGDVGPLIDGTAIRKVDRLVRDATRRGATVLLGGAAAEGRGHFYPPTVLAGVSPESELCSTEIFGPVAALMTFEDEADVVAHANATEFGLAAYVFTRDLSRALRVSEQLEVGCVGLNTGTISDPTAPFGGVKQSGLGIEGGPDGIKEFLETKTVAVQL
ncbi:NAD-dependent succinate-semialdehyde dehydrogenase [Dactylosporangium maewongense]|uniref:NAD-dependent succinate-semialdehyde dehydrogenase n=1 Tax=Dactylosporangium maewongense TaxID=634393 RepID=A0ABN2DJR9_9ACTN